MYLLDTNVISELRKSRCHPSLVRWMEAAHDKPTFLSVVTLGEVRNGIEALRRRDSRRAAVLDTWFQWVCRDYRDRILPVSMEIAEEWGRLGVPDKLPTADGLLAATAKVHGLTLITRNVKDFVRTGARIHDPFEG